MQNRSGHQPFAMPHLPMVENSQKLVIAAAHLQANAFKALMRYQIETLTFLKHRYEQDIRLVENLVDSDAFTDAFDVMSNFFENAITEYATEGGKVASIGSKIASDNARLVRKEASAAVEDMAARTVA